MPRLRSFMISPMGLFFAVIGIGSLAGAAWFVADAFVEAAQKQDDELVAYTGARIHTASGPVIERGTILVKKGKILDVGSVNDVPIPKKGARVVNMTGKVIIPGLVDTHSHIGIFGR